MSFDMLNKQGSKYTNHNMPVFVSCHFFGNESQVQKVMQVGCDWWVLILVCLACRKVMSGDVIRVNDTRFACNTESG